MAPPREPDHQMGEAYSHAALGFQFAGGVLLFLAIGWLVDRWLGTLPAFTVAGALLGAVLSFLSVYYRIRRADEARREEKERR